MSTVTVQPAKPAIHLSPGARLALVAVVALIGGGLLGYAVASARADPATPTARAQVTADNAMVDRWTQIMDSGTREEFDSLVRPNVRFTSINDYQAHNADLLWSLVEAGRIDKHVHARTSDVTRVGDMLFWTGTWAASTTPDSVTRYAWMVRLDPQGRFVNIAETTY